MRKLTIGQLAKQAGLNVETVRYYERRKLIPSPPRFAGGYRIYADAALMRVKFIIAAKQFGFSLQEIEALLVFWSKPDADCGKFKQIVIVKIRELTRNIQEQKKKKRELDGLISKCRGKCDPQHCLKMMELAAAKL